MGEMGIGCLALSTRGNRFGDRRAVGGTGLLRQRGFHERAAVHRKVGAVGYADYRRIEHGPEMVEGFCSRGLRGNLLAAALAFTPEGEPSSKHPFALKTVKENFNFLKEQAQKEKRSESGRIVLP